MKTFLKAAFFVGFALACVWLGAYACIVLFPNPHWARFPSFLTAFVGFISGFAGLFSALFDQPGGEL